MGSLNKNFLAASYQKFLFFSENTFVGFQEDPQPFGFDLVTQLIFLFCGTGSRSDGELECINQIKSDLLHHFQSFLKILFGFTRISHN